MHDIGIGLFSSASSETIPVGNDLVKTSGYSVVGIGSAFYASTSSSGVTAYRFQSANGRWFQLAEPEPTPEMFGAVNDGSTDDTASVQAAVNYCKSNRTALYLLGGAGYLISSSVDCTGNSGAYGFWIYGISRKRSGFIHAFPAMEVYPVLDMAGNGNGGVSDIYIIPKPMSSSFASCGLLSCKDAGGSSHGNSFTALRSDLNGGNQTASSWGVVSYNSDLSRIIDTSVGSALGGGLSIGMDKDTSIVSKYTTIPSTQDFTQCYLERCELHGCGSPALWFSGGGRLFCAETYAVLGGDGSAGYVVRIGSINITGAGNTFDALTFRTENQSSSSSVSAIHFPVSSNYTRIYGNANSGASGYSYVVDSGATLSNVELVASNTGGATFNLSGGIKQARIFSSASSGFLGTATPAALAATNGITFIGGYEPDIRALFGATQGLEIYYNNVRYVSDYFRLRAGGNLAPVTGKVAGIWSGGLLSTSPYTGGSGEQTAATVLVPAANLISLGGTVARALKISIRGFILSSATTAGQIRVRLTQGSTVIYAIAWVSVPVYTSSTKGLRIDVELSTIGSPVSCFAEIAAGGQLVQDTMSSSGFNPTGGDITLDILVQQAASNPYTFYSYRIHDI